MAGANMTGIAVKQAIKLQTYTQRCFPSLIISRIDQMQMSFWKLDLNLTERIDKRLSKTDEINSYFS